MENSDEQLRYSRKTKGMQLCARPAVRGLISSYIKYLGSYIMHIKYLTFRSFGHVRRMVWN